MYQPFLGNVKRTWLLHVIDFETNSRQIASSKLLPFVHRMSAFSVRHQPSVVLLVACWLSWPAITFPVSLAAAILANNNTDGQSVWISRGGILPGHLFKNANHTYTTDPSIIVDLGTKASVRPTLAPLEVETGEEDTNSSFTVQGTQTSIAVTEKHSPNSTEAISANSSLLRNVRFRPLTVDDFLKQERCSPKAHTITLRIDGCERTPVRITHCRGKCASWQIPSPTATRQKSTQPGEKAGSHSQPLAFLFVNHCNCCRQDREQPMLTKSVDVNCDDGPRRVSLDMPTKCVCDACPGFLHT